MKKRILIGLGVIFLAFLGWRLFQLFSKGTGAGMHGSGRPPVAVEVDSVHTGPIEDVRLFTGSVYPLYRYIVAPKVPGRVIQLTKRIGDTVQRNEVIARIDDAEYQQAVLEAEANLKIAQSNLIDTRSQYDLAKKEYERAQSLKEKGLSSPSDYDAAKTKYEGMEARLDVAKAQVEQRQAALESAKIRLSYTTLRATEPGYIGERYVDEGALLSTNSPVVSVIGIDTVYIRTTVIERDYGRMKIGQEADVDVDAYPNRRFIGHVSRIAPMLRETSRVAEMEVLVPNDSLLLKPGMFARVNVILDKKADALLVPSKAVVRRNGDEGVFAVSQDEKTVKFVPVKVGIVSEKDTEILDPPLSGEVVTLGQHLLEDGSPILLSGHSARGANGATGGAKGAQR